MAEAHQASSCLQFSKSAPVSCCRSN